MKKTKLFVVLALVLGAVALVGCNGKSQPTQKEKEPFYAKEGSFLYLNVRNTNTMKTETEKQEEGNLLLSPLNIVKYADCIISVDTKNQQGIYAVTDKLRDIENCRIKMWSEMVISKRPHKIEGERGSVQKWTLLDDGWISFRDVRLAVSNIDPITTDDGVVLPATTAPNVVAYIPNAKMDIAQKAIRKAWSEGNNEEVYRLFQEAFTFIPITDKAWKELKAKGEL